MRFWGLTLYPLMFAAVFGLVALALSGEGLAPFLIGQKLLVRLIALAGCWAALSVFERGDHLYDGWRWLSIGLVLVFVRDVAALAVPASDLRSHFLLVLGVAFNFLSLAGIWRLAGAWRQASLDWSSERTAQIALAAVAAVVALAAAGPSAWKFGAALLVHRDLTDTVLFVSALVDIVSLCLIAPLAATAWQLRGGLFSWPFALLAASRVAWLLYDAAAFVAPEAGAGGFPYGDLFRGLGGNFLAAAGFAQYLGVRDVRRAG